MFSARLLGSNLPPPDVCAGGWIGCWLDKGVIDRPGISSGENHDLGYWLGGTLRGSKRNLIVDSNDMPLAACVTGANRHGSVVFEGLLDALPAISGKPGRPRRWLGKLHADKVYDIERCRNFLSSAASFARITRKSIERDDRLGRHRWIVDRTHAWFTDVGNLHIRF